VIFEAVVWKTALMYYFPLSISSKISIMDELEEECKRDVGMDEISRR